MSRIKYSKILTNGYQPLVVSTINHTISFEVTQYYIYITNLNDHDVFVRVNNDNPIRIPSKGYLEVGEQSIQSVTFETLGSYEYVARY